MTNPNYVSENSKLQSNAILASMKSPRPFQQAIEGEGRIMRCSRQF